MDSTKKLGGMNMNFDAYGILTMVQQKEGKNGIYTVVTLLFNSGKTMDFLYKGHNVADIFQIERMSKVVGTFEYTDGKYKNCTLLNLVVA